MSSLILNGRTASQHILDRIQAEVAERAGRGRPPGLAVIQVGDLAASNAYIRHKEKAAAHCGMRFDHRRLPSSATIEDLIYEIDAAAADPLTDGLIVQLPFDAPQLQEPSTVQAALERIPPEKDADGLSVLNQGRLFTAESTPTNWTSPLPATPLGVFRLLEHYSIPIKGRIVTVVGRSRLVGFPTAGLLSLAGATVSLCHRRTKDLTPFTSISDIVVVAAGAKHLIRPDHLKEGAVVVDVGIHALENGKLTGDVHPDAHAKCSAYSPVPGGVGPMTVASLMENTWRLFQKHYGKDMPSAASQPIKGAGVV